MRSAEPIARDPQPARPAAPRVVVVDDDPLSSALQAHLAALLGYVARAEHDAAAALAHVLDGHYDAMLLDIGMPAPDGFEVVARLRDEESSRRRRPIPVIAVTGYASERDRLRCLLAGFSDHLAKPVRADVLGATLARVFGAASPEPDPYGAAAARPADRVATDAARLRMAAQRLAGQPAGERAFAPSVAESFAMRAQLLLEAMDRARRVRDSGAFTRSAQSLRASGDFLGATRFARMCTDAADDARAGRWDDAGARLQALEAEHHAILTVLFQALR